MATVDGFIPADYLETLNHRKLMSATSKTPSENYIWFTATTLEIDSKQFDFCMTSQQYETIEKLDPKQNMPKKNCFRFTLAVLTMDSVT
jgi:hypothetical protein